MRFFFIKVWLFQKVFIPLRHQIQEKKKYICKKKDMELSEMQVNDWYLWYAENQYYAHKIERKDFADDNHLNFYSVPINNEMFEANGFKHESQEDFEVFRKEIEGEKNFWKIEIYRNNTDCDTYEFNLYQFDDKTESINCGIVEGIEIKYVHVLQNFLRNWRDLADFADNFRLTDRSIWTVFGCDEIDQKKLNK